MLIKVLPPSPHSVIILMITVSANNNHHGQICLNTSNSSILHKSQELETIQALVNWQVDKHTQKRMKYVLQHNETKHHVK